MTDRKTCASCGAFMHLWEGDQCDACDPFVPLCDYRHDEGEPPADWFLQGESGEFYVCDEHFQMRTEEGKRGWVRWQT